MRLSRLLNRLRRQIDFARHVPPRQIAARARLSARRFAERQLKPKLAPGQVQRSANPPLPVFPPRTGMAQRLTGGGWAFNFLGRAIEMPDRIDWSSPGRGAGEQLWRMNLHYMEYLEELGDEDALDFIRQWIAANPAYARGSESDAWNAYALSLRVVVWMQQIAARGLQAPDAEAALGKQLVYLERHLETDIGGNHLVKNIKALLWASAFFEGSAAARWRRKGLALLRRELPRQFLTDGMHFELSPSYHCQVLGDLIEIRRALGGASLRELEPVLARAAGAAEALAHPDGYVAQFSDAGLTMAYSPSACLEALESRAGHGVFALPDAGYYGARWGSDYFVADVGRIAPDALPAHGHGDMLSFEWSVDGKRMIVDQGVFEYVAGDKRDRSRTAHSHNTLTIGDADQAEFFGAFRSARRARPRVIAYERLGHGFVLEAEHDGYSSLPGRPVHRRLMAAAPDSIRIEDRIIGDREAVAHARLLLAPGVAVERLAADRLRITRGGLRGLISASEPLAVEKAVCWPDMGVELPTLRIVMELSPERREAWMELRREAPGE